MARMSSESGSETHRDTPSRTSKPPLTTSVIRPMERAFSACRASYGKRHSPGLPRRLARVPNGPGSRYSYDWMFSLRVSLLVARPRLRFGPDELVVVTSWIVRLISAFSYNMEIRANRRAQVVFLEETKFWFLLKRRVVRFRDIDHVKYSFRDAPTSWDLLGRIHDTVESFTVGLALKDSTEVIAVARFAGEGAAGGVSTWLLGDDLLDLEGTQADDSRRFVEELCKILDVSLGPAALEPPTDEHGMRWRCTTCCRSVPPKLRCLYCGGETHRST